MPWYTVYHYYSSFHFNQLKQFKNIYSYILDELSEPLNLKNFLAFLCREVSNVGILFKDYKTNELNSADGPFRFELPDMDRTFAEELLDAKPGPLSLPSPPKIHWNVKQSEEFIWHDYEKTYCWFDA